MAPYLTSRSRGSKVGDVDSPALGAAPGHRVRELHVADAVFEIIDLCVSNGTV